MDTRSRSARCRGYSYRRQVRNVNSAASTNESASEYPNRVRAEQVQRCPRPQPGRRPRSAPDRGTRPGRAARSSRSPSRGTRCPRRGHTRACRVPTRAGRSGGARATGRREHEGEDEAEGGRQTREGRYSSPSRHLGGLGAAPDRTSWPLRSARMTAPRPGTSSCELRRGGGHRTGPSGRLSFGDGEWARITSWISPRRQTRKPLPAHPDANVGRICTWNWKRPRIDDRPVRPRPAGSRWRRCRGC